MEKLDDSSSFVIQKGIRPLITKELGESVEFLKRQIFNEGNNLFGDRNRELKVFSF